MRPQFQVSAGPSSSLEHRAFDLKRGSGIPIVGNLQFTLYVGAVDHGQGFVGGLIPMPRRSLPNETTVRLVANGLSDCTGVNAMRFEYYAPEL